MTILLVHWGRTGGGVRFMHNLALGLIGNKYPCAVSFSLDAESAGELSQLDCPAMPVKTFHSLAGALLRPDRVLANAFALARYIHHNRIGTILFTMEQAWQGPAVLLARLTGAIVVVAVHDADAHEGDNPPGASISRRLHLLGADGILLFSKHARDMFIKKHSFPTSRVAQSIHGLEITRSHARRLPAEGPITLGFFGRILPYKGVDIAVAAWRILRDAGYTVQLHIYGNGRLTVQPDPGLIVNNAWIAEAQVQPVLSSFDLLLLPYREASQSGVLALSASLGIPAVCTPVEGLLEQGRLYGCATFSSEVTAQALADRIRSLLHNPTEYEKLSGIGIESSALLSWSTVAKDISTKCEEIHSLGRLPLAHRWRAGRATDLPAPAQGIR